MQTHDIGKLFWHFAVFRAEYGVTIPLFGRIPSQEIEGDFRRANAFFLRVPGLNYGMVFGKWTETNYDQEEALMLALHGRGMDLYDPEDEGDHFDDTPPDELQRSLVRQRIAERAKDLDEEWEVLNALNLLV